MENESIKTLLTRRSVRKFKPEHITEEEMETILEAGKYAPTGRGTQCTKFVAIRNKAVRDKLSEMNAEILGVNHDPFYGAPDVIAVFANSAATLTWVEDGALAMGNLMNAAHALGIGSCWIHRARETFDSPEGRAMAAAWGLPEGYEGIGYCILGYAEGEEPLPKPRKEDFVVYID